MLGLLASASVLASAVSNPTTSQRACTAASYEGS
jgi:hypothetical protein